MNASDIITGLLKLPPIPFSCQLYDILRLSSFFRRRNGPKRSQFVSSDRPSDSNKNDCKIKSVEGKRLIMIVAM